MWLLHSCIVVMVIITTPTTINAIVNKCGGSSMADMTKCEPPVENVAFGKLVRSSETCGVPEDEEYARWTDEDGQGGPRRVIETCRSSGRNSHPVTYLTDIDDQNNRTYWQSKTMMRLDEREVTLTVSFGKEYEISYVYVNFNSIRPRAMAIYKSQDKGRSWIPYQYFSADCLHHFNIPPKEAELRVLDNEVLCSEQYSSPLPLTGGSVAFNPTTNGGDELDNKFVRQEWVTATDLKFKLISLNNPAEQQMHLTTTSGTKHGRSGNWRRSTPRKVPRKNVSVPSAFYYAVNDIEIGARCKCNGHASRCVKKNDQIKCECQHNTAGDNCEKCRSYYHDRPWQRATAENANPCMMCNCNGHSSRCRYSPEMYTKTGRKTGSICHKCRHHTTGFNCQYCKDGFFRSNRNITHPRACRPCKCHRVGSVGTTCNPTTGECLCKTGVTGRRCTRCAKGFRQTRSSVEPCGPNGIPQTSVTSTPTAPPPPPCRNSCKREMLKMTSGKYCSYHFVIKIEAMKRPTPAANQNARDNRWVKVIGKVEHIFKRGKSRSVKRSAVIHLMVRRQQWTCICPKIRHNRHYLVMGTYYHGSLGSTPTAAGAADREQVYAGSNFVLMTWQDAFKRKLRKFASKTRRGQGGCSKKSK